MKNDQSIHWNNVGKSTIVDDLNSAPKNQAEWEKTFKDSPMQSVAVSPSLYKLLTEGHHDHYIR